MFIQFPCFGGKVELDGAFVQTHQRTLGDEAGPDVMLFFGNYTPIKLPAAVVPLPIPAKSFKMRLAKPLSPRIPNQNAP